MCVCVWAQVSAAPRLSWPRCWGVRVCMRAPPVPRQSWLGCSACVCVLGLAFRLRPATPGWGVGVCVLVCVLPLYPATPGWGVRRGCVCLGSGVGCARPLLAGMLGCVTAGVVAPLVPRHSWMGCWGVCVCRCARFACTPPLLAWVCGVAVSVWAQVSAAPRHSWLGCWGVPVGVRAPLVPRHSWLGCAAWVCVLRLGCRLRPATPGWGVGVCVCWCCRSSCTPPFLAGMCGVGVCVFGLGLRLRPAFPGRGVGVCVFVCVLPLYPATPGWGVRRGCVCLSSGLGCAPLLLAGVLGCVCAGVRAPLVPRHSWLCCPVWVCVFGLGLRLRPATPGWAVGGCVLVCVLPLYPATPGWGLRRGCVCLGSGVRCAPPLLAGLLGCVYAGVRALLVPRNCWLGCVVWVCVFGLGFGCAPPLLAGVLGCVCAGLRAPPVPRHSWLGCAMWVCVLGLGFWLRPATPGWGLWCVGWLLHGTRPCAVVGCVLCALPRFAAPGGRCCLAPVRVPWLWPATCLSGVPRGPALVRRASSGRVALGAPFGFPDAVDTRRPAGKNTSSY